MSSSENINILVTVDTGYIKKHYGRNTNPDSPSGISHTSQFMVATDSRGIVSGQGTADLNFKANSGDFISFSGTSSSANSDDAVIVYGIKHWDGDDVFNKFLSNQVTRAKAVMPNSGTDSGIPPLTVKINFMSLDSRVKGQGTENFYVYIAVYELAGDGETQTLYGYFYWDPTITVG